MIEKLIGFKFKTEQSFDLELEADIKSELVVKDATQPVTREIKCF